MLTLKFIRCRQTWLTGLCILLLALTFAPRDWWGATTEASSTNQTGKQTGKHALMDAAALRENYGKLPLSFEANQGQVDPQVKFLARGRGYNLFLTTQEAVLALHRKNIEQPSATVGVRLLGTQPTSHASGVGSHALAVQRETAALRPQLQPVFFNAMPLPETIRAPEPVLSQAAAQLTKLAADNDAVVNQAFSNAATGNGATRLKTMQFLGALRETESLAESIGQQTINFSINHEFSPALATVDARRAPRRATCVFRRGSVAPTCLLFSLTVCAGQCVSSGALLGFPCAGANTRGNAGRNGRG